MISKEETIKRLEEARFTVQPYLYMNEAFDVAIESLSKPERPKGRWEVIGKTKSGANILQCSNCKRIRRGSVKSAFCRDCGADMRGEEK